MVEPFSAKGVEVDLRRGWATLLRPGEAESGSAGVQPDKEYPGRRCAEGASGSRGSNLESLALPSDTGAMP